MAECEIASNIAFPKWDSDFKLVFSAYNSNNGSDKKDNKKQFINWVDPEFSLAMTVVMNNAISTFVWQRK